MDLDSHQQWLIDFYQQRGWYELSPFIRLNFLTEEVGELSRAVRAIKLGRDHPGEPIATPADLQANLEEELADVLDQVLVMSAKMDVDPQQLLTASEAKLKARFHIN